MKNRYELSRAHPSRGDFDILPLLPGLVEEPVDINSRPMTPENLIANFPHKDDCKRVQDPRVRLQLTTYSIHAWVRETHQSFESIIECDGCDESRGLSFQKYSVSKDTIKSDEALTSLIEDRQVTEIVGFHGLEGIYFLNIVPRRLGGDAGYFYDQRRHEVVHFEGGDLVLGSNVNTNEGERFIEVAKGKYTEREIGT